MLGFIAILLGATAIWFCGLAFGRWSAPEIQHSHRVKDEARLAIDVYASIYTDLNEQPDVPFDQSHTVRMVRSQGEERMLRAYDWEHDGE